MDTRHCYGVVTNGCIDGGEDDVRRKRSCALKPEGPMGAFGNLELGPRMVCYSGATKV